MCPVELLFSKKKQNLMHPTIHKLHIRGSGGVVQKSLRYVPRKEIEYLSHLHRQIFCHLHFGNLKFGILHFGNLHFHHTGGVISIAFFFFFGADLVGTISLRPEVIKMSNFCCCTDLGQN